MDNNTNNDQRSPSSDSTTSFDTPNLYQLFLQKAFDLVNDDNGTTTGNRIGSTTMMAMSKKSNRNKSKKSNSKLVLLESIKVRNDLSLFLLEMGTRKVDAYFLTYSILLFMLLPFSSHESLQNIVRVRNMGIQSLSHHDRQKGNEDRILDVVDDDDIHGTNMKLFLSIMTTINDMMSDSKVWNNKDHDSDDEDDDEESSLYDTLVSDLQALVASHDNNKGSEMTSNASFRWTVNSLIQELRTLLSHRSKACHALSMKDNEDNNNSTSVAASSNVYHDALQELFIASMSLWQWKLRTTILLPIVKGWMIEASMITNDTTPRNVTRKRKTISDNIYDACSSNVGTPPPTSNSENKRQHCLVSVTPPTSTTKQISIETPPLGKTKLSSSPRSSSSQQTKSVTTTSTTTARASGSFTFGSNGTGTKKKNDSSIQKQSFETNFETISKAWDDSSDDDDEETW